MVKNQEMQCREQTLHFLKENKYKNEVPSSGAQLVNRSYFPKRKNMEENRNCDNSFKIKGL